MSESIKGFVVTLDHDMHEEDAEAVANAIRMIKHVISAKPLEVDLVDDMARDRVKREIVAKLWEVLK